MTDPETEMTAERDRLSALLAATQRDAELSRMLCDAAMEIEMQLRAELSAMTARLEKAEAAINAFEQYWAGNLSKVALENAIASWREALK